MNIFHSKMFYLKICSIKKNFLCKFYANFCFIHCFIIDFLKKEIVFNRFLIVFLFFILKIH